ncbi:MAG: RtcB family protein, partial [Bdellovibrionales bacterium]|nr:RtcB family protein [Bdellovibrionales bacterium]
TDNAVIPYAVGVDIACRVMITAFDIPMEYFYKKAEKFKKILEDNTQFGIGANWQKRKDHSVMSDAWGMTPLLKGLRDKAWSQLGTSGSGNHFVEFGELEIQEGFTLAPGRYLALVSHSGSRGAGASIAMHYSNLARKHHPNLPKGLKQLAWLPLDHEDGIEYWESMQLMGRYASANHHIIHESIGGSLRAEKLMQVENHHNFAWKEVHGGKEVVVHRKGATPAGKGVLGYIPGSMTAPGFLVEGKGNEDSLYSCSHGAGRRLSRKQAKNSMTLNQLRKILSEAGVELLSAGLDEAPHAYKDINQVMSDQRDLVQIRGRFQPRLVKMASPDEKPED